MAHITCPALRHATIYLDIVRLPSIACRPAHAFAADDSFGFSLGLQFSSFRSASCYHFTIIIIYLYLIDLLISLVIMSDTHSLLCTALLLYLSRTRFDTTLQYMVISQRSFGLSVRGAIHIQGGAERCRPGW